MAGLVPAMTSLKRRDQVIRFTLTGSLLGKLSSRPSTAAAPEPWVKARFSS